MGSLSELHPSLWITSTATGTFPPLPGPARTDVCVVGAGLAGLAIALDCARAGASVIVVEAGDVCAGASGRNTAKFTSQHGAIYHDLARRFGSDTASAYAAANQAGLASAARNVVDLGLACDWTEEPSFLWTETPDQVPLLQDEAAAAAAAGLPAEFVDSPPLPWPTLGAVVFAGQARCNPRAYGLGLAAALRAEGAAVHARTRALAVEEGTPNTVVTEAGAITADHVVLATHLPFHDPAALFARSAPYRSYCIAVELADPPPAAMFYSVDSPSRSMTPAGGNTLVVGGGGHKVGEGGAGSYRALEDWAAEHFDVLEVTHRWSAQDWIPADGIPFIGRLHPGASTVWVATGFQKWGLTTSHVAASIISDGIAGRHNPWAATFDACRGDLARSATKLVKENVAVARHMVGDRLKSAVAGDVDDIPLGSGAVVRRDGEAVAAYRDESGRCHTVSATCTHLGCLVEWNLDERTWDCPCHGSRFSALGAVLEGPAVRDLPPA